MRKVVRPLQLQIEGEPILASEKAPKLLKDALFYISIKTEGLSDKDFENWILEKKDNHSREEDEKTLVKDVFEGEFMYLIKTYKKLPAYIAKIIDQLIEQNTKIEFSTASR